jgi:hypothetical protein
LFLIRHCYCCHHLGAEQGGHNVGEGPLAQQASTALALARAQQGTPTLRAALRVYRRSSKTSNGSSSGFGPFTSDAECDLNPVNPYTVTPKELDLQEQRRCALEQAGSPAGGYLAVCLAVKSECLPALPFSPGFVAAVRRKSQKLPTAVSAAGTVLLQGLAA